MNVLGFSGISHGPYYQRKYGIRFVGHDSAAALIQDGRLLFAVEEERLTRDKHTSRLPVQAIAWGLRTAGLTLADVDVVSYTWNATPLRKLHMYWHHPLRIPIWHWPALAWTGTKVLRDLMSPRVAIQALETELGQRIRRHHGPPHHLTHAACAYFTSPFDDAAVLTVDGQGEDESATLGQWQGTRYTRFQSVYSPDSIGILYGMVTDFLGMRAGWDEYKVMGMAAYGDARRFANQLDTLVHLQSAGRYRTLRTAMVFKPGYCELFLTRMLGIPQRDPAAALDQVHFDLAAALQSKLEQVLFHLLHRLRERSPSQNLCLGGGVFLNSVANGKIRQSGLFDRVHIPPVPGDHGGALGAAAEAYHTLSGAPRCDLHFTPFSGPGFTEREMEDCLGSSGSAIRFHRCERIADTAARLLADAKILGWFQGQIEYGPRALGHRSILAHPGHPEMKDRVNKRTKHREPFRPFAASVPAELAAEYFDISGESPYMQFVMPVREDARAKIPAVVHHGTCRLQTVTQAADPLFHELLHAFGRCTSVPILLNTSFNDCDEPLVCSPQDAVRTFLKTALDALVMGPFLVQKRPHALG